MNIIILVVQGTHTRHSTRVMCSANPGRLLSPMNSQTFHSNGTPKWIKFGHLKIWVLSFGEKKKNFFLAPIQSERQRSNMNPRLLSIEGWPSGTGSRQQWIMNGFFHFLFDLFEQTPFEWLFTWSFISFFLSVWTGLIVTNSNRTLILSSVNTGLAGVYHCTARNLLGEVASPAHTIDIQCKSMSNGLDLSSWLLCTAPTGASKAGIKFFLVCCWKKTIEKNERLSTI